mmetsp:Transcript_18737/g.30604  ORF Transcript_18737/g.30604 Transcript_18737/m.30604 type:complete len:415 (+) Transcript_18737:567-1811(+)
MGVDACSVDLVQNVDCPGEDDAERDLVLGSTASTCTFESEKQTDGLDDVVVCMKQRVVGLAFDDIFLKHRSKGHCESPQRLIAIRNCLSARGLWEKMSPIVLRPIRTEELTLVHDERYVRSMDRLQSLCHSGNEQKIQAKLDYYMRNHEDVFFTEDTVDCAKLGAGASIEAVRGVVEGGLDSAVVLCRPPGHHAAAHAASGFCVYNNVMVAARHALEVLGLKRVLIVDWDVHHGDGTQRLCRGDSRIMYVSIHKYNRGKFYPGTEAACSSVHDEGRNINIALNGNGHGDVEYLACFDKVIVPMAREFAPELVIVSAGFDAAKGDKMGGFNVTPEGYALMTRKLEALARCILILEGGYHLESLSNSVAACVEELLRVHPRKRLENYEHQLGKVDIKPSALVSISQTLNAHARDCE